MKKNNYIVLAIVFSIYVVDYIFEYPISNFINSCFVIDENKYFEKNLLGNISLKIKFIDHIDRVYYVRVIKDSCSNQFILQPIGKIIDISTWREVKNNSEVTVDFEDKNNKYRYFYSEDRYLTSTPKTKVHEKK